MNSFISVPLSSLAMTLFYMPNLKKKILSLNTELFDTRFLSWILKASNFFKQYLNIGIYRMMSKGKRKARKERRMWKEIQIAEVTIIGTRGGKAERARWWKRIRNSSIEQKVLYSHFLLSLCSWNINSCESQISSMVAIFNVCTGEIPIIRLTINFTRNLFLGMLEHSLSVFPSF